MSAFFGKMKAVRNLLTIKQSDIDPDSPLTDVTNFRKRSAARAVLLDKYGRVYLLNVSKHGYHKLPGGGIDEGEEIIEAMERELLEEVGCRAEILAELGTVIEYRDYYWGGLRQISYCFLAKQVGEQKESALEEGELRQGMFEVRAKDIDDAIRLLQEDKPDNFEGKFIQKRDLCFLMAARKQLYV